MAAIIGLGLIFSGIIVFRIAAVGTVMRPPVWWAADAVSANLTVPFTVGMLGFGVAELIAWTFGGEWRSLTVFQAIGIAAVVAANVLVGRVIASWSRRVRSGEAVAAPALGAASVPASPEVASI